MTRTSVKHGSSAMAQEYANLAASYDRRWASYIAASHRHTLDRLDLSENDRVLDIGCGTGILLQSLAQTHAASLLTGIDPVSEMLAVASSRLQPAITLRQASADKLPFAACSFDVLIACSMFHYIEKPEAAAAEWRRVLRAGGRLVVTDWCGDYRTTRLCTVYLRLAKRTPIILYRQRELQNVLERAGFRIERTVGYKISRLWGLMTMVAYADG